MKKQKVHIWLLFLCFTFNFYVLPHAVFAANTDLIKPLTTQETITTALDQIRPDNAPTVDKKLGSASGLPLVGNIKTLLQIVSGLIASFAGTYAIIMLISHAFKYTTSGGDKGKMDGAIKGIQWSLIGLVSISLAFGIINTIISFTFQAANDANSYGKVGTTPSGSVSTNPIPSSQPNPCPSTNPDGSVSPCTN